MKLESGYSILEAEDLVDGTTLAEVNEALREEDLQNTHLVDTRSMVINSRSVGYNGNIMLYSQESTGRHKKNAESILSEYFEPEDVAVNYSGRGFEHSYYELVNL